MSSPPENIRIKCPQCGCIYDDWWRPSINLGLDSFDEDYVKEASESKCPDCGFVVKHDVLVVDKNRIFHVE